MLCKEYVLNTQLGTSVQILLKKKLFSFLYSFYLVILIDIGNQYIYNAFKKHIYFYKK